MSAATASELKPCRAVANCMASPQSYKSEVRYSTKQGDIAAYATRKLEEAWTADQKTHADNAELIEASVRKREQIIALMQGCGIPDRYERRLITRSRFPKRETRPAGYLEDLAKFLPVDDGFAQAETVYKRLAETYAAFTKTAADADASAEKDKERAKAEELEKRRAQIGLAAIILRYQMPEDSSESQILDLLRGRDQRVDLAVAMMDTRGDWSDGAYRVSDALNRFEPKTQEDVLIKAAVHDALVSFGNDADGRVFRDCSWNYNAIMETVPEPLRADAIKVRDMVHR